MKKFFVGSCLIGSCLTSCLSSYFSFLFSNVLVMAGFFFLAPVARAQKILQLPGLYRPSDLKNPVPIADLAANVKPGDIVLLGEIHFQKEVQSAQLEILKELHNLYLKVSVGWEFIDYTQQKILDDWKNKLIDDAQLLSLLGWKDDKGFALYKPQLQFPFPNDYLVALNAPNALIRKVGKQSLVSLTPEENDLLPPQFQIGRASYFSRFQNAMSSLPPEAHGPKTPAEMEMSFQAQSVWDDTMAWKASEFISAFSDQVLVVLTGVFHVNYGGGFPDRLRNRTTHPVHTLVFIPIQDRTASEIQSEILDDPTDGSIADWVYLF